MPAPAAAAVPPPTVLQPAGVRADADGPYGGYAAAAVDGDAADAAVVAVASAASDGNAYGGYTATASDREDGGEAAAAAATTVGSGPDAAAAPADPYDAGAYTLRLPDGDEEAAAAQARAVGALGRTWCACGGWGGGVDCAWLLQAPT